MNKRLGILAAAILASLAMPALLAAQGHPAQSTRYTLVDLGTFGGPNSFVIGSTPINERGTVAGVADTSVFDPICGCVAYHAFEWQDGTLTDLGTLPGGSLSGAFAINSPGAVGGASANGLTDPDTGTEAFVAAIWRRNGEVVDLGTLGGSFSLAFALNDREEAVGAATNTTPDSDGFGEALIGFPSATRWHAAVWLNGTLQDLGTLGDGPDSSAFFVNERGQVAGVSYTDSIPTVFGFPTVHPFLWESGQLRDLGSLGGVYATPNDLNNRGQVVGYSTLTGDLGGHAFLWTHGAMQDLGTLSGDSGFSEANAINDDGEIAGHTSTADGALRGFRWERGVMADLGSVPGYDCGNTDGINAEGTIVGWAHPCDESAPDHAFLWEKGRPGIDLNTLVPPGSDLELIEANSINDRGEIAGLALLPNGDAHAFVLIPGGHDDDALERAGDVSQNEMTPVTRRPRGVTRANETSEMLASFRARITHRYSSFGSW